MKFERAFKLMQNGEKIKLPSWGGYWYWDDEKKTVIMHTKDGQELDIRETERVIYTLSNILDDGWVLADDMGNKAIAFHGTSGVQLGWLASQSDMLSEDWTFVED